MRQDEAFGAILPCVCRRKYVRTFWLVTDASRIAAGILRSFERCFLMRTIISSACPEEHTQARPPPPSLPPSFPASSQIRINFNITMLDVPCEFATVDVLDVLGTNQQNVTKNIEKWNLDQNAQRRMFQGWVGKVGREGREEGWRVGRREEEGKKERGVGLYLGGVCH